MAKILLFGGTGAILNCAIAARSTVSLENSFAKILTQPFSVLAVAGLTPAFLGFLLGTAVMFVWNFIRAMVVRLLLTYNGWFLNPNNPINKLWFVAMLILVGRKNWGSGKYQQLLPSLPVPPLDKTLQKLLETVKPVLTEEEFKQTEKAVKSFKKQGGKELQSYLYLRSWTKRNWMADWWTKYKYYRRRYPISLNSNYFTSCDSGRGFKPGQLDRAAMLMYLKVKGCAELVSGKSKNLVAQNLVPFCMNSMKYIPCTCRIPGVEEDRLIKYNTQTVDYCVVFRKGRMYEVKCKSVDGEVLPPAIIKRQLERIVEIAGDEVCEDGYVASFTGLPRTKWAEIRERLLRDPVNKKTLETIQSCYAIFELADESPKDEDFTTLGNELFHGRGHNRWYDKTVSVIVFANGKVGVNVEHSTLDGTMYGQFVEYLLVTETYTDDGRVPDIPKSELSEFTHFTPKELTWNLTDFKEDIVESKKHLQSMVDDSDLIVTMSSYGKRFPKQCRLSPDGWIQMALQLTYYKLYRKVVLTYEPATTRWFYKGRTDFIRSVSEESKKWVEAMENKLGSKEQRKNLLKEAIAIQARRKYEAMRGLGIDRHLFGLRVAADQLKMDPLPDLFNDKALNLPYLLFTSQTPLVFVNNTDNHKKSGIGGYGTFSEQGYSICYLFCGEDKVSFVINSKRCCPDTSSSKFAQTLNQVLEDMKELYISTIEEKV